jgi:PAS domain S-box-containing protein
MALLLDFDKSWQIQACRVILVLLPDSTNFGMEIMRWWRATIVSLMAACLAAGLFAGFVGWRNDFDLEDIYQHWDLAAVAGALAAVFTLAAYAAACLRYRRVVSRLGGHLGKFRQQPSAQSFVEDLPHGAVELDGLLEPLRDLCASYRKALAQRVKQEESLESMRQALGQLDTAKGQRLTVRGSGSSRNMVARFTPNLFWMTATAALQQFLNCKMTDLNAKPLADIVHKEDMPLLQTIFQEALETGEAHNITLRVLPVNQVNAPERHVAMDVLTRYTEEGKVLHFRCYFVDISDRVRAEQEVRRRTEELSATNDRLRKINSDLERLKESYRDLYHHAPVMFFSLDAMGFLATFNQTLLANLGYARDELWKQPYTALLPPALLGNGNKGENLRQTSAVTHHSPLTREGEVETRWQKKDGTIIDVWIRTVPVEDVQGRFVRSRSAALDVTERNRLANELRARRDELERTNADLRVINRELEEFTSVVSHDLKEPLRTLQAFSGFLAEDFARQLGPDGFQYINHLVQASRRMGALIDDLLTLSGAGKITDDLQSFNMNEIVATVRGDLVDLLVRKEGDLVVEGSLPTVVGDPRRITQLLANLVGNGLKYNTNPKPKVVIGQAGGAKSNGPALNGFHEAGFQPVTLFVRDNGIGIDRRYHEQIFGIFRRLHQPEEYEGTGAGLAICKKIVEAHGGQIWLESAPGQGSTFYFTLPRAPQELTPEPARANRTVRVPGIVLEADKALSRPHLLLVEDMPEMALIVQKLSERAGHRLVWLKTAEEASDYLNNEHPDLVLLDIHLPGMSGVDLCRRLQMLGREQAIALFTQGDKDEAWAQEIGARFILSKELLCSPEAWLARLDEMLAEANAIAAPASRSQELPHP